MRFGCLLPHQVFVPACMAILIALLGAPALAGTMYEFKIASLNDSYQSEITLGSGSGGAWSIINVHSEGVLSSGGQQQSWSGAANGTFNWSSLTNDLSVQYTVQNSTFNMSLSGVAFTGGTSAATGLPVGRMLFSGVFAEQGPRLVAGGADITWVTSNIDYFRQDAVGGIFGEQDALPVPGVGALCGFLGAGMGRRSRRRNI